MKLKKLPLPIAGTALGTAALGNLLQTYALGKSIRPAFGIVASIIIIAILIKFIIGWKESLNELDNPVVASSFVTFFMTFTILSSYLSKEVGVILWYIGVIGHLVYLIWFILKYFKTFNIKTVFPSWFVPFVGFVTGSVTAPKFGLLDFGRILFWIGLGLYVVSFILVTKRMSTLGELPPPAAPTRAIYAAPASLLLAGYIASFTPNGLINANIVYLLLIISIILYIYGVYIATKHIPGKFLPSFSSFTFPYVISAIALKSSLKFLKGQGMEITFLNYLVYIQEIIALIAVVYVLVYYILLMIKND